MNKAIYLFSISSHPNAIHINSLDIKLLKPTIDFSKYDYLILTSKQATKSLQQYKQNEYINKPALCISEKTAKSYEEIGGSILKIGSGYGDKLSKTIQTFEKTTKWLYLRAKIIASDFVSECKRDGYNIDESILYESLCSQEILNVKVEENAILIFTSPSSLECFLKTHTINKKNKLIVIGRTTAKKILHDMPFLSPNKPSIEDCVQIALAL